MYNLPIPFYGKLQWWGLCAGKEFFHICFFVTVNSKDFDSERHARVLRFFTSTWHRYRKNKRCLLYFSSMAQQRAFRQRNRRRAWAWHLPQWSFMDPLLNVECLSVRSLESLNRCTCASCTWLPFLNGQALTHKKWKQCARCVFKCGLDHT